MQNAKNSLSVIDLNMRTTSSLESFNAYLNRTIEKRGNFFKFVVNLKIHESRKADTMYSLVHDEVPDAQYQRRKLRDRQRDAKVEMNRVLLRDGKISVAGFLDAISCM